MNKFAMNFNLNVDGCNVSINSNEKFPFEMSTDNFTDAINMR